ncbi:MAG: alpha/beta hydrolase [Gammaproteobacteria bacterium]|nr:alpha/beta hydrolase [Gammaproteobacteria bacterium]
MRKLILLAACLLAPLTMAQAAGLQSMPGRLYDIGDIRLHMTCMGEGGPTVILEAGLGGFSLEWLAIQRRLADSVQTCAYDRAGYGWSDTGPSPRTTSQINGEFERLLNAARLPPPYILVGHSFGGYNAQYFAKANPDQVAGIILIDSSHPDQAERIPEVPVREARSGRPHIVTFFNNPEIFDKYPEDVRDRARQVITSRRTVIAQQRELANFTYSGSEVNFLGDNFPDVPLVVITRGQQEWPDNPLGVSREQQWREMQEELAELSPRGRHIYAEHSGHMIHLDQPELVADIIRDMVRRCDRPATVSC